MTKPEVLAIVPARCGSKGIPRKNIRLFAGYPLIAYSIAAALQAEIVTRVVVTTDDEEIAEVARQYGGEAPFLRPAELGGDRTLDLPVFQHAMTWLAEHEDYHPVAVVHLRPTTPLRPPDLVDRAVRILLEHPEADSVRGLTPAHQNPFKMWLMDSEDKPIRPLMTVPGIEEPYNAPRQILPSAYAHNGLIDIIRPATILKLNSMSGKTILPVMFDPGYDIDLDTPNDWRRAEERIMRGGPLMVWPGAPRRPRPEKVELLILDFDGVLTDNRVWVDQDGREIVAANRSDSLWLNMLREKGVQVFVISKETNPVVAARCRKMNVPYIQGEDDKETALKKLLAGRGVDPARAVYCGNDVNDLPCFPLVGWAVAVADSAPEVVRQADFVLSRPGGHGAVRELCELILTGNRF
ncbi:MAG: acylneuraminate cytidylyltransferase [Candidatus Atribacteria bacterium]|nr:acylneuraminate cytidylyltransferase [Candidatus Atribacteria bacterium]